jgi:bifunctional DNA-binding transcriptional regulator/antitoxin component of YhaV-PrlF toxin-antitoxin module
VIERAGRTATGIEVPEDVVTGLGAGRRPSVSVTIGTYTYPSTVATRGGRFLIPISAEVRRDAGVEAGDEVDVELVLDTAPRVVTVPPDLAEALDADPAVRAAFDGMSYSHQRQYVLSVQDARTAETRQRRIAATITKLRG